ncbi:MAG: nucleotide exchange factor GrpE [Bacillota bacterium]|nr:MAG: nucleotide exchange factor GrpE [Bacillota bacterium]
MTEEKEGRLDEEQNAAAASATSRGQIGSGGAGGEAASPAGGDGVAASGAGEAAGESAGGPGEERAVGPEAGGAAERIAALEAECRALQERVAAAERLAAERLEQLQRLQADFANYRRRMMQEQARWREQAIGEFVLTLLPVVDNLERALQAGRDGDPLKDGVVMVHRQFLDVLRQVGVEPIEAEGRPFDPRLHEAVAREETDRVPDGHVIEVYQRGYLYQGRTLRPALTKVAVGRPAAPAAAQDETGAGAQAAPEQQNGSDPPETAPSAKSAGDGNADAEEATSR